MDPVKVSPPLSGRMARTISLREASVLLLLPLLAWQLAGIVLINQDQTVDPWLYTGYGRIFPTLFAQFGWQNYYVTRFPVIFLNETASLLPPVTGYVLLRYLLFVGCGTVVYLWARRFGRDVALTSYAFLAFNPLFPRVILWDLTTFVSVPAALAGMCIWLSSDGRHRSRPLLSGMLWTISAVSHAFTGTAIATFLGLQVLRRIRSREWSPLVQHDLLPAAAGVVITLALGTIYYWVRVDTFEPITPLRITWLAIMAGHGYATSHHTPLSAWAAREYHVYVPVLCVLLAAVLLGRRLFANTQVSSIWWFAAFYTTFYAVYQLMLGGFVLETWYYFAHLELVVFLLVPVILSELLAKVQAPSRARGILLAAIALVAIPIAHRLLPGSADRVTNLASGNGLTLLLLCCVAISFVGGARWMIRRPGWAAAAAMTFVLLVQVFTFLNPAHGGVFDRRHWAREKDVYAAAATVADTFGEYWRPDERVMLWYCSPEGSLGALASSVLLFTVQEPFSNSYESCDGRVGAYEHQRLTDHRISSVMMLDETGASFAARDRALRDAGYDTQELALRKIGGETYHAVLRLVRIEVRPSLSEVATRAVALPSLQVADWSAEDLHSVGQPIMYGTGSSPPLVRDAAGTWAFVSVTDHDHLATPFLPMPSTSAERFLAIVVKPSSTAAANCVVYVQDDQYRTLDEVHCSRKDSRKGLPVVVPVPPTAKAFRVFLTDPKRDPIVLPQRITVTLHSTDARAVSGAATR